MKNKKGFTLIELLAVIVVLAIIMVIATMQINKTIKKARKDAFDLAFENLRREIKQRIVTGDEYLCYDGADTLKGFGDYTSNNELFGNYHFGICGSRNENYTASETSNGVKVSGNEDYTASKTSNGVKVSGYMGEYGNKYCQDIYDISDDYHMWVSYQLFSGEVSLQLSTTNNSKFKGVGYKQDVVDTISKKDKAATSTLDNKNFKIEYRISTGVLAGVPISMKNPNNCELNTWGHYSGDGSYQCNYQWDADGAIDNIKDDLSDAGEPGPGNTRIIEAADACEILTRDANWKAVTYAKKQKK